MNKKIIVDVKENKFVVLKYGRNKFYTANINFYNHENTERLSSQELKNVNQAHTIPTKNGKVIQAPPMTVFDTFLEIQQTATDFAKKYSFHNGIIINLPNGEKLEYDL